MITVQPLADHERPRCACCGNRMMPGWRGNWITLKTEDDLKAFSTNRRVIQVRRKWHRYIDDNDQLITKLSSIDVRLFPLENHDWGYDGIFCKADCAQKFGRLAYRAGYRKSEKAS